MPDPPIQPRALPNDLPAGDLHLRPNAVGDVSVWPDQAGWRYLEFNVREVPAAGRRIRVAEGRHEMCLVVLAGHEVTVTDSDGTSWRLPGRESVFHDLPSAL